MPTLASSDFWNNRSLVKLLTTLHVCKHMSITRTKHLKPLHSSNPVAILSLAGKIPNASQTVSWHDL